jgi:hypothetical protein
MMISESDIYLAAQIMVREYGDKALAMSQTKTNKFWDAGDDEGAAVWMRIAKAIEELRKMKPAASDQTH